MCLLKVERVDRNHNDFVRLFFDDGRDLFNRVMLTLPILSESCMGQDDVKQAASLLKVRRNEQAARFTRDGGEVVLEA